MAKKLKEMGGGGAGGASVGGIAGMQVPLGVKKRKKKVDEMLDLNEELSIAETISYFSGLDEDSSKVVEGLLDEDEYVKLAEMIKQGYAENALRHIIRKKVREVVRKKAGSDNFVLYSPNPGKQGASKAVGEFPTKLAARRAELQRFPPKEPAKLARMKKDVEKLRKNPEKASEKEKDWLKDKPKQSAAKAKTKSKSKKESLDYIAKSIAESIFREEKEGSEWDEYISKLSKQAVLADKTFQNMQKNIIKRSEKALKSATGTVKSSLGPAGFKLNDKGIKKDSEAEEMYSEFFLADDEGTAEVGPFYVKMVKGSPAIDVSQNARNSLTRLEPDRSKVLRSKIMEIQEDMLDSDVGVAKAIQKRDEYLKKLEGKIDGFVADLNALEITMLKNVLVNKYRKIG
jgi:hypothetical protein